MAAGPARLSDNAADSGAYTYSFAYAVGGADDGAALDRRRDCGSRGDSGMGRIASERRGPVGGESLRFAIEVAAATTVRYMVRVSAGRAYRASTRGGVYDDAHFRNDVPGDIPVTEFMHVNDILQWGMVLRRALTPLGVRCCCPRPAEQQGDGGGHCVEARVMSHNLFELQSASDQGIDAIPRITLVLGNADSHFSELERATGWKGSRLTASFLFYDLRNGAPATESTVLFQGICNPPDEIRESTFRITATNRMNLQRLLLPQVRIQRRCGWEFPATEAQRTEAIDGGANGKYSRFYRCGYSGGLAEGTGSLSGSGAYELR